MTRSSVAYLALVAGARLVLMVRAVLAAPGDWNHAGDIGFYYQLAQLSDRGFYPFIQFWTEYPPVFPFLVTGFYRFASVVGLAAPGLFTIAVQALLAAVDIGNLVLVYQLVRFAHGERAARFAAALYAVCPALVFFSSGWFDPLAVLFSLAALYALVSKRPTLAGFLIALGVLTKIYPGVLLVVAPAALGWRGARRASITMLATLGVVLAPLAMVRGDLLFASFASMATRPPWETVPALMSGNYAWGIQPQLEERFTAATAFVQSGSPVLLTLVPETLVLVAIGAGWLAWNRGRTATRDLFALAALAVVMFLLGNKGFSPQFIVWIIPLILLVWPNRVGLAYLVALSAHFMFYDQVAFPAMHGYFEDGNGSFERVVALEWESVIVRTGLMVCVAVHLFVVAVGPIRWRARLPQLRRRTATLAPG
jgi:uncharacterized membrane protein